MRVSETQLNRYERAMYAAGSVSPLFRSVLAGVSRSARLARCLESDHQQAIWNTGANVIGPLLLGYVLWVFRQAQAMGLNRLYFVSRDGQILQRIATAINERYPTGISCRYLYGSRQAWQLPAVTAVDDKTLAWVLADTSVLTVRCACERVDLAPENVQDTLAAGGFPCEIWDDNLDAAARRQLRECFCRPAIQSAILEQAKRCRELAIRYFTQEGLLEDELFAIVDIGWNGRLQMALSNLLGLAGFRPPTGTKGLYFGLWRQLRAYDNDVLQSYFLRPESPHPPWLLSRYVGLLEIFMAADHRGVRGYYGESDGQVEPVFFAGGEPPVRGWGVATQQDGCLHFAKELVQTLTLEEVNLDGLRTASEGVLQLFLSHPTPEEARAYGRFELSEQQTGQFTHPLTPVIGHLDVWRHLTTGRTVAFSGEWLEGAIINSELRLTDLYLQMLSLRTRLRHRYRLVRGKR